MGKDSYVPLFETRKVSKASSLIYKLYASSQFVGILLIWAYRTASENGGSLVWAGMFVSELWFGLYWILTQALRWNRIYRHAFTDRLAQRYKEEDLPDVDIFVCTADPTMEPPMMVINTVLSVLSYDYPPEKLSVYLSDDAGSDLTFFALLEASEFAKHWIPYCKKFLVESRSPAAYFREECDKLRGYSSNQAEHLASVEKMYRSMENRIELAGKLERVSKSAFMEHRGFAKWDSFTSERDHSTILQIVIDRRDAEAMDTKGCRLPTLVYLAREKRPQHFHNFKAGAINALIRVSSRISNAPVILNIDCDMYSNSSQSIREALCFLMDEEKGRNFAYVQFPQNFYNLTKNDIYGGSLRVINEVEFHGFDGCGGPLYIGSGCFHRRDALCGRKLTKEYTLDWKQSTVPRSGESVAQMEDWITELASCMSEKDTEWGHEMGIRYGCLVEDAITGLSIQSRGWKSVYYNPKRRAFLGVTATTMDQTLVQHKRWSEGGLQAWLSKYNPVLYGLGKISFGLVMGYSAYFQWPVNCFATLYYSIVPSLCLLKGISLFPQVSSLWFLPFGYVIMAEHVYSFYEYLWSGGTALGWWNEQRMWLYRRTTSYLFATIDTLLGLVGYSDSGFVISTKVSDEDSLQRYKQEKMEFGTSTSPMFTVFLSSLAMTNLFCLTGMVMKVIWKRRLGEFARESDLFGQIVLCGVMVLINLPLYDAALFRKDKGSMPNSVTLNGIVVALALCASYTFL